MSGMQRWERSVAAVSRDVAPASLAPGPVQSDVSTVERTLRYSGGAVQGAAAASARLASRLE